MKKSVQSKKINTVLTVILFLLVLTVTGVVSAVIPKKSVSELENRNLAAFPQLSLQALSDGSWTTNIRDYAQDHIIARDMLINLSSGIETSVFGKTERDDILLGKSKWMFQKKFAMSDKEEQQFDKNVAAVAEFSDRYGERMTFMLVPSSGVIYSDNLPEYSPQTDENALLDKAFAPINASSSVIDLRGVFLSEKDDAQLYYKTDHHWTTQGAYLAYLQYCEEKSLQPFDPQKYEKKDISEFFGTHYSASRWNHAEADILSYYQIQSTMTVFSIDGEDKFSPLHETEPVNTEKLNNVDKYGAFLDGNHGYVELSGKGTGKVLVIKDSYANCFVPFLTENYETVGVVDFRNFSYGPDSLIETNGYNDIIVLYSLYNFIDDNHVIYLNRPSVTER